MVKDMEGEENMENMEGEWSVWVRGLALRGNASIWRTLDVSVCLENVGRLLFGNPFNKMEENVWAQGIVWWRGKNAT